MEPSDERAVDSGMGQEVWWEVILSRGAGDRFEEGLAQRTCEDPRLKFHASQSFALRRTHGVRMALHWVEGNWWVGGWVDGFCESQPAGASFYS